LAPSYWPPLHLLTQSNRIHHKLYHHNKRRQPHRLHPQPKANQPTKPLLVKKARTPATEAKPGKGGKKQLATINTGPSEWQGRKLRHPRGGKFYPTVVRWANLVKMVMREKKIPRRFLKGILAQIQQESAGNPNAVNNWDINAARGTPSKGLLQVIAPTYRYHAKPGCYQTVPYTNLWAALEYVLDRYGKKKFKYWNRGYNQGY